MVDELSALDVGPDDGRGIAELARAAGALIDELGLEAQEFCELKARDPRLSQPDRRWWQELAIVVGDRLFDG